MIISVFLGTVFGNIAYKFLVSKADRFMFNYKCDKTLERTWLE